MQLACISGDNMFNKYVLPTCPITISATAVTSLYVSGRELFSHKEKVQTVEIDSCPNDFMLWLTSFEKPVLVCHNGKVFDAVDLMRTFLNHPANVANYPLKVCRHSLCIKRSSTKPTVLQTRVACF